MIIKKAKINIEINEKKQQKKTKQTSENSPRELTEMKCN